MWPWSCPFIYQVLQVLKPAKREEKLTALEPHNEDKNRDLEILPSKANTCIRACVFFVSDTWNLIGLSVKRERTG